MIWHINSHEIQVESKYFLYIFKFNARRCYRILPFDNMETCMFLYGAFENKTFEIVVSYTRCAHIPGHTIPCGHTSC